MKLPLDEMSVRASGAMTRSGIITYEALSEKTAGELLKIKNIGRSTLRELERFLAEAGYSLSVPTKPPTPTQPLTDNERLVLKLRGNLMSYVRIGIKLDLSPTRVVQIEKTALAKRRKHELSTST